MDEIQKANRREKMLLVVSRNGSQQITQFLSHKCFILAKQIYDIETYKLLAKNHLERMGWARSFTSFLSFYAVFIICFFVCMFLCFHDTLPFLFTGIIISLHVYILEKRKNILFERRNIYLNCFLTFFKIRMQGNVRNKTKLFGNFHGNIHIQGHSETPSN